MVDSRDLYSHESNFVLLDKQKIVPKHTGFVRYYLCALVFYFHDFGIWIESSLWQGLSLSTCLCHTSHNGALISVTVGKSTRQSPNAAARLQRFNEDAVH